MWKNLALLCLILLLAAPAAFASDDPSHAGGAIAQNPPAAMGCPVDLVLALDGSGSIDPGDFATMKQFVRQLIDSFPINPNDANVGIIQFSDNAELYLEISSEPAAIRTAIDNMAQFGQRTDIAGAIELAQAQFLTRRQNLPRVIVIFTDGMHNM